MKCIYRGLIVCLMLVCALGVPGRLVAAEAESGRPNIIFLMTDDMGYGDASCYNPASKINTPHLDQMAKDGILFTDAHSPSAVCTPTRYGVLTGRYCWRSRLKRGVFGGFNHPLIETDRLTVASFLKRRGYATACIGKWHLGLDWTLQKGVEPEDQAQFTVDFTGPITHGPQALGFDMFFGTAGCTTDDPPFCFIHNHYTVGIPNVLCPIDPAYEGRRLLMVPGWNHEAADTTYTLKAIDFIESHVKTRPDDPFFVYLPLSLPHKPWLPPDFVKGETAAGPRGDQVFLADWCLGKILATLDKLNISENTLVIFTSDNGPRAGVNGHSSAGELRGLKGSIWEGGHRVPFVARWPARIKPGQVSNQTICLTDLLATCAAILGERLPDDAGPDSYNILPALVGETLGRPIREATVHHSGAGRFAIRQGDWKLVEGFSARGRRGRGPGRAEKAQLYNLAKDLAETTDVYSGNPEVVERLTTLLKRYKTEGRSRP